MRCWMEGLEKVGVRGLEFSYIRPEFLENDNKNAFLEVGKEFVG